MGAYAKGENPSEIAQVALRNQIVAPRTSDIGNNPTAMQSIVGTLCHIFGTESLRALGTR
jgi:hypothetical protein